MKKLSFMAFIITAVIFSGFMCSGGDMIYIGHRGSPEAAPENTLESFMVSVSRDIDAVECDIRQTADGKLVLMHDETTGRVWNEDVDVEHSDRSALDGLRINYGFKAAFPRCTGAYIPEFSELADNLPKKMKIFAELKTDTFGAAEALMNEVSSLGLRDRTTIISFSRERVAQIAAAGFNCALLVSKSNPDEVLKVRVPSGAALDVNLDALDANCVATLHERGYTVYCWNAKNAADCERARIIGVDGVTCDNVSR